MAKPWRPYIDVGPLLAHVLLFAPVILHHRLLSHPRLARTSTPLIFLFYLLVFLLTHTSAPVQWYITGATYVIAMKLLAATHFSQLAHSPLYIHSSPRPSPPDTLPSDTTRSWDVPSLPLSLHPIPLLDYVIFLFTATSQPPSNTHDSEHPPVSFSKQLVHAVPQLLLKYVALHLAVRYLAWAVPPWVQPPFAVLSLSSPSAALLTWSICAAYCVLLLSCMSALTDAAGLCFSLLSPSYRPSPFFHHPYLATSPRSFWSLRWNKAFTSLYRTLLFSPLTRLLHCPPLLAALCVFSLSALLHVHQAYSAFRVWDAWGTAAFFVVNGAMCALQVALGWRDEDSRDKKGVERGVWETLTRRTWRGWVEWAVSIAALVMSTSFFFPPYMDGHFVEQLKPILLAG